MGEWKIVNQTGVAPKVICFNYSKRGVAYFLTYSVYWDSKNKIHYFNPSKPFMVWCTRKNSREKTFSYDELVKWLNKKKLPIPPLPYKPA